MKCQQKEARSPIIIMNDYCIHLNGDCQTRQACAPWFSSRFFALTFSFPPGKPTSLCFLFLQVTTPSKAFVYTYILYLFLYLSSLVYSYVLLRWQVVGNDDDNDKNNYYSTNNNNTLHSLVIFLLLSLITYESRTTESAFAGCRSSSIVNDQCG